MAMKLNSLLLQTSMIFARNESEVLERESYIVIKTPNNPGFHWGNYLIFKKAPAPGDIANWIHLFQKELSYYESFNHYVFAWDEPAEPQSPEYLAHGLELEKTVSLETSTLTTPKHYNQELVIRPLVTSHDWQAALELQVLTRDPKYSYAEFKKFKEAQDLSYQKLVQEKRGGRFGAFYKDVLIADLGIYFEGSLARYQNVVTHPDYRRMGACATLVYESGKYALKHWGIKTLCMVADPDYHAARIYESVGFAPKEFSYNLYWFNEK